MENQRLQQLRRSRLREWIRDHHEGRALRFAKSVGKAQSQIADMLDGRKAFGEKVARDLERKAHMPELWLDNLPEGLAVRESVATYYGVQLTRAGALLAAEWEKLDVADRIEIENDIHARVAAQVRAKRKPGGKAQHDEVVLE